MCPDFRGDTGPAIPDREYAPGRAKSHIQLYPPVSLSIHEFVICVLKKVEKYLANLGFAAANHGRRVDLTDVQTDVVCPELLRA